MSGYRFLLVIALVAISGGTAPGGPSPDDDGSAIKRLRAGDVDVRRDAAIRLHDADRGAQRAALPAMIDVLMQEKDGQVRLAVLDTVLAMGPDAASAVPALVHTLRTDYGGLAKEELHQDYRSALALAAIGKPAVDGLRGLLKERKENVRAEVVMALGRIGPDAGPAIPDLLPLLGAESERVRREASIALGRIGLAAVDALVKVSASPEATIRTAAVASFGHLASPDDRARRAVLDRTHDSAPEVRAAALRSLAKLGLPDDVLRPVVEESLRDGDEAVRLAVVELLLGRRALLGRLTPTLASLLTAEHQGVSRQAAFLLGTTGPDAVPVLIDALRRKGSRVEQIAEALAGVRPPAVDRLSRAAQDPDPRVRRGSALAIGQIRPLDPSTVRRLTTGLADPDPDVRAAFLTAIATLGARAGEAVPAVRAMLPDRSPEIRLQAVDILFQAAPRDDRLLGELTTLLGDPDTRVQRRAIDILRALGPPGRKALPDVIAKLDSPDLDVRQAAAEWIGSHGPAAAEAVPALGTLLVDPSPTIRAIAARALGKIGKPAQPALNRLSPLLEASQVEVREAVVSTLGALELESLILKPYLARALRDDAPEVRRAALRTIQRLGPEGALFIPDLILSTGGGSNRQAERLLRQFERTGPDVRSVPEFVALLTHREDSVRLSAIKFLGLAGRSAEAARPALERLRDDPNDAIRKQATAAIEQIQGKPAPKSEKIALPE